MHFKLIEERKEEIKWMSQDYIIGKNPVLEALRSEHDINKILIAEGSAARTNATSY